MKMASDDLRVFIEGALDERAALGKNRFR